MQDFIPYTYLIGWSHLNKYYYGSEFSNSVHKIAHPNNLWTKYYTSSKIVKEMRILYGEPDIIQVRKTFTTAHAAHNWEYRVLTRLGAAKNDKFINQHNAGFKFYCTKHSPETLLKMSKSQKGRKKTQAQKDQISATLKATSWKIGFKESIETKRRKSIALTGYKRSEEHQQKLNRTRSNIKYKHWSKQHIFTFTHKQGEVFTGTRKDMKMRFPELRSQYVDDICSGKRKSHKGWKTTLQN